MHVMITKKKSVEITTLAEAGKVCRQYIQSKNIGNRGWMGGQVYNEKGDHVATVSYNGRVWPPQAWHEGMKPLVG